MKNCDFNLRDVYRRCDKIGPKKCDLVFQGGMSTHKVLKVLLYREMQVLNTAILLSKPNARKKLAKTLQNILYLLLISRHIFDTSLLKNLSERFTTLETMVSMADEATIKAYVQTQEFHALTFDMDTFLREESSFYLEKRSDMPLHVFIKKRLANESFKMASKIKKSLR